jgi:predicted ATPase
VLLEDPEVTGILCLEEPENGIHPANVMAMVELIRDLALDPAEAPGDDNPVRQVIVNTHSPTVVQLVGPDDLLFADLHTVSPGAATGRHGALRLRPMRGSWRDPDGQTGVGKADLITYLSQPPGAQLILTGARDTDAA